MNAGVDWLLQGFPVPVNVACGLASRACPGIELFQLVNNFPKRFSSTARTARHGLAPIKNR